MKVLPSTGHFTWQCQEVLTMSYDGRDVNISLQGFKAQISLYWETRQLCIQKEALQKSFVKKGKFPTFNNFLTSLAVNAKKLLDICQHFEGVSLQFWLIFLSLVILKTKTSGSTTLALTM